MPIQHHSPAEEAHLLHKLAKCTRMFATCMKAINTVIGPDNTLVLLQEQLFAGMASMRKKTTSSQMDAFEKHMRVGTDMMEIK